MAGLLVALVALLRLHPVATVALGAAALVGFLISISYVLSHYDECGACDQTTGAHFAGTITFFFMALAPLAIVLGGAKFMWSLVSERGS